MNRQNSPLNILNSQSLLKKIAQNARLLLVQTAILLSVITTAFADTVCQVKIESPNCITKITKTSTQIRFTLENNSKIIKNHCDVKITKQNNVITIKNASLLKASHQKLTNKCETLLQLKAILPPSNIRKTTPAKSKTFEKIPQKTLAYFTNYKKKTQKIKAVERSEMHIKIPNYTIQQLHYKNSILKNIKSTAYNSSPSINKKYLTPKKSAKLTALTLKTEKNLNNIIFSKSTYSLEVIANANKKSGAIILPKSRSIPLPIDFTPSNIDEILKKSSKTLLKVQNIKRNYQNIIEAKNFTILIDPGHGGKDSGAIGVFETYEKDLVLRYSKALYVALEKIGYSVEITRNYDKYLTLKQRREKGRLGNVDLFISIHADSALNVKASGISVYVLSEKGFKRSRRRILKNKQAIIGSTYTENKKAASFLMDIAQKSTTTKSKKFANILLKNYRKQNIRTLSRKYKTGNLSVLRSPETPSVLIEIGFISNAEEEILLNTQKYQNEIIYSTTKSINKLFKIKDN